MSKQRILTLPCFPTFSLSQGQFLIDAYSRNAINTFIFHPKKSYHHYFIIILELISNGLLNQQTPQHSQHHSPTFIVHKGSIPCICIRRHQEASSPIQTYSNKISPPSFKVNQLLKCSKQLNIKGMLWRWHLASSGRKVMRSMWSHLVLKNSISKTAFFCRLEAELKTKTIVKALMKRKESLMREWLR